MSTAMSIEVEEILRSCKVTDLTPSFWGKRILRASRKSPPEFTMVDKDKAANWTVCACGQLSPNIGRDEEGQPVDETLAQYGLDFYHDVIGHKVDKAAETLVALEERADEYLLEQANKRGKND